MQQTQGSLKSDNTSIMAHFKRVIRPDTSDFIYSNQTELEVQDDVLSLDIRRLLRVTHWRCLHAHSINNHGLRCIPFSLLSQKNLN